MLIENFAPLAVSGTSSLWLYFVVVFSVVALPGMDMAFVMGSSMASGRSAGLAAVGGIVAGGVCHMLIGATGIFALVALVPGAFNIMLIAGAAYLGWIGWTLLRVKGMAVPQATTGTRTKRAAFFGAMATGLLNPKAYMFMLAIFPQFVHPEQGSIWVQAAALGAITAATQTAVYGAMALLAAHLQNRFSTRPAGGVWFARGAGAILLIAAALTLASGISLPKPRAQAGVSAIG